MELVQELVQNQIVYIPVLLVIFLAVLVFVFGFQTAKEPAFIKLLSEDKRQQNKKRKIKEKKPTANGNVVTSLTKSEKSPQKETKRSPQKDIEIQKPKDKKAELNNKVAEKNKRNDIIKSKVGDDVKTKKNLKKVLNEKPADFDEGNWETVTPKNDKKKKQESPTKRDKKIKKIDKPIELENVEKDSVNREELQIETEKEVSVEKIIEEVKKTEEIIEEPVLIIEDKKEKKKEKKQKKDKEIPNEVEAVSSHEINIVKKEMKDTSEYKHPAKEEKSTSKPPSTEIIKQVDIEPENKPSELSKNPVGGVAFDELGDVWTEAKIAKKSKKKARKDN